MSLARFVEKWTSGEYPPEPISEEDVRSVEQHFGAQLPDDYRQAVVQVGLPRPTIALLDAIVDHELDLHSLGDFYSAAEIIEETISWRELGMPEDLVAIASDGSGNKFCFDANRLRKGKADGQSIWFFDHDFGTVERVASSFTAWINAFCDVEPSPQT